MMTNAAPQVRDVSDLHLDEKVWWMHETTRDKPMHGPHRYQVLLVRRGEFQYCFEKDLGSSLLYPLAAPFNFWAANCYSVGEVMEIAERLREGKPPEEDRPPTDLMGEYAKALDERGAQRRHRTVSGPFITIARG